MTSPDVPADAAPGEVPLVDSASDRARLGQQLSDLARAASGRASALRGVPGIGTWSGLALTLAGVSVLVLGWSRVADIGVIAHQMPYVISAGGAGLALIAVGLAVVAISAKVADAARRRQQLAELQETMAAIRAALEDE